MTQGSDKKQAPPKRCLSCYGAVFRAAVAGVPLLSDVPSEMLIITHQGSSKCIRDHDTAGVGAAGRSALRGGEHGRDDDISIKVISGNVGKGVGNQIAFAAKDVLTGQGGAVGIDGGVDLGAVTVAVSSPMVM